jgi:molybdopterin converting factor small subunit
MKINIRYFAKLREERGCSSETIETGANSVLDLFKELQKSYNFSMNYDNLKVAVNDEFSGWETLLKDNDIVVFIQPVAGG